MANHTIVSPPSNANQENVAPSVDPLANVRSTARKALARHIDRSAKQSGKRSRGPRSSDAEKVESLFGRPRVAFLRERVQHRVVAEQIRLQSGISFAVRVFHPLQQLVGVFRSAFLATAQQMLNVYLSRDRSAYSPEEWSCSMNWSSSRVRVPPPLCLPLA